MCLVFRPIGNYRWRVCGCLSARGRPRPPMHTQVCVCVAEELIWRKEPPRSCLSAGRMLSFSLVRPPISPLTFLLSLNAVCPTLIHAHTYSVELPFAPFLLLKGQPARLPSSTTLSPAHSTSPSTAHSFAVRPSLPRIPIYLLLCLLSLYCLSR